MITDVPGVLAGHWTGTATGVTVVVFPPETVGSVEIRGGAPATRETAVLDPFASVEHVDAIVLTGGSAFGLASADGVVQALAELGRGFPTRGGPVPIVPAAAIFDLVVAGDERPGADEGRAALAAALDADAPPLATGRVGAGRGASVAKWRGGEHGTTGGIGTASARDGEVVVAALVVVNAVGDVLEPDGTSLVASQAPADVPGFPEEAPFETPAAEEGRRTVEASAAPTPRWWWSPPTPGARRSNATCSLGAPTTAWRAPSTRRTRATTAISRSRARPAWSTRTSIASG